MAPTAPASVIELTKASSDRHGEVTSSIVEDSEEMQGIHREFRERLSAFKTGAMVIPDEAVEG